jgi:hypothetical protein
MAKINDTTTYPPTTPALDDHVPGTDISDTGNDANGETVTFTLEAMRDLFFKGAAQCYFQYTNATTCTLARKDGAWVQIAGALYQIPSVGVTLGTGGLSPSTLYYVYAYMSGSTLTLEASATAWAASTTAGNEGMPIKSGDNTRTLVGMLYTNGSTQFDAAMVISYWNPTRRVTRVVEGAASSTTSSSWVAIGTAVYFLWFTGFPLPQPTVMCPVSSSGAIPVYLGAYLNGSTPTATNMATAATFEALTVHGSNQSPSQGRGYFQGWGVTNSGTATYGYTAGGVFMETLVEFWG